MVLVILLVVLLASGTAIAGGLDGPEYTQTVDEENETAPHENPDEAAESGDDERVGSVLSSEMSELLGDSATEISEQQYEMGRSLVGEEYDDQLERFVDVADDIQQEETAESFEQAQETQQSIAEKSAEFDEKMAAYEEAVEDGDEERARELARELQDLAAEIDESTARIDELYGQLEAQTGEDFSGARESTTAHRNRTTEESDAVRDAEFLEATLHAEANRTDVSFENPAGVTGELRSEEGDPIDNATIELQAGADTMTVVTDADGAFQATYRPTLAKLDQSTLSIEYVPETDAPYLAAETTVSMAITEQAESALTITEMTEAAAFDETVSVAGSVTISDAEHLNDLPIRLSVGGQRLGNVTTTDGEFEIAGDLPKHIAPPEADIIAELALEDAAVAPANASQPLQIDTTETNVTLDVDAVDRDTVTVSGELQTDEGAPVSEAPVTLTVDGDQFETTETDAAGRYATQVTLDGDRDDAAVVVGATFDGEGTNLHASGAEQRVELPAASAGTGAALADAWLVIGVLTGVFGSLLLGWLLRREADVGVTWIGERLSGRIPLISTPQRGETDTSRVSAEPDAVGVADSHDGSSNPPSKASLAQARSLLSDGHPGDAVVVAYSTLRGELIEETSADASDTHWEFYRRCRSAETADSDSLRTVTEAYETAVFAPHTVSADTADDAVEAMSQVLESLRSA
ncbi:hypothetical protein JCM17823_11010 [Halorubrum gandharaense]